MNDKVLRDLGFTPGETKVYLSLLKLGKSSSGAIVDKSGVSKSKVYEILEKLTNKGVVSQVVENKIKVFQAMHPKELLSYLKQKEDEFKETKKALEKTLPEFEHLYNLQEKQDVTVYRGYEGMKKVHNLMIEDKQPINIFVSSITPKQFPYLYEFDRMRIDKKIKLQIIYHEGADREAINRVKKVDPKFFSPKIIGMEFQTPAVFNTFGEKTGIIIWSENPIVILIENKEATESFNKYFELLWSLSKEV